MKVKELIAKLQTLDPELAVMRSGYESGVTDITNFELVSVALNYHTEWYYGKHRVITDTKGYRGYKTTNALILT